MKRTCVRTTESAWCMRSNYSCAFSAPAAFLAAKATAQKKMFLLFILLSFFFFFFFVRSAHSYHILWYFFVAQRIRKIRSNQNRRQEQTHTKRTSERIKRVGKSCLSFFFQHFYCVWAVVIRGGVVVVGTRSFSSPSSPIFPFSFLFYSGLPCVYVCVYGTRHSNRNIFFIRRSRYYNTKICELWKVKMSSLKTLIVSEISSKLNIIMIFFFHRTFSRFYTSRSRLHVGCSWSRFYGAVKCSFWLSFPNEIRRWHLSHALREQNTWNWFSSRYSLGFRCTRFSFLIELSAIGKIQSISGMYVLNAWKWMSTFMYTACG